MFKLNVLALLVSCQIILAINGELKVDFEDSFLPYDRTNNDVNNKTPIQLNNLANKEKLQKFETEILPLAKSVQIYEIEEEKNLNKNNQEHKIIILDMISKISDKKIKKKRAINPKYRAASLAFFGAILNNQIAKKGLERFRGKRSVDGVEGFYKPSLHLLSGSYGSYKQAAEPVPQQPMPQVAAPQYQQTYQEQAPQAMPQVAAPEYQQTYQEQAMPQSSRIENTCSIGFSEPIHAGQDIVETYCRCPSGTYGIDCTENFYNPCTVNGGQYHPADASIGNRYFIECNWNTPYLFKCPSTLVWNQEIETCDWAYTNTYESSSSYGGY